MVTENDWRQFISTGTINHETVREIIAESWMRCKKLGMDPLQQHSFDIITGKTLKNILLINKTVLDISTPIMENLYQFLKGSNFILVLSDSSGYIIKTKGSK
jgi:transcriptional regulator of acetoin/glycerol metabolism